MTNEKLSQQRVRYFSRDDLSAGLYADRVVKIIESFTPEKPTKNTTDIIELFNAQKFIEAQIFPSGLTVARRTQLVTKLKPIKSHIARFFSNLTPDNITQHLQNVDPDYHADLIELLSRTKIFEHSSQPVTLDPLWENGVRIGIVLSNKKLVKIFDQDLRELLCSDPLNATYIIQKYLQDDGRRQIFLPTGLTAADCRDLLMRYIEHAQANFNHLTRIENAPANSSTGIDSKVKLAAKRRRIKMTNEMFESNPGLKFSYEVRLSEEQEASSKVEIDESDGLATIYTYSSKWLEESTENPSVLNNFQHLFEYANSECILNLPSYEAHLGVIERITTSGPRHEYRYGSAYNAVDAISLLQLRIYRDFLNERNIDIEAVISWFFSTYLDHEFNAKGFLFHPCSDGDSYLQKTRHLFAELESILNQFSSFVTEGTLDWDLLNITSDPLLFANVPSLTPEKYLSATNSELLGVLDTLFSDQSLLAYIEKNLTDKNAALLIASGKIRRSHLKHHHRPIVDRLLELGVLIEREDRLQFRSQDQVASLASLYIYKNVSYHHLGRSARSEVDAMKRLGWLEGQNSLLTPEEAGYFNFLFNKAEFTNGPELRNKYLHGSQSNTDTENTHFKTYLIVLRSILALVIKINDDFCIAARRETVTQKQN